MRAQFVVAAFAGLFAVTPLLAQTTAPTSEAPAKDKTETSCNTAPSSATTGSADKSTGTSTAMEKSAILPSAGGHANSAAPTVQSDGKPMEARPDCPPETKK